MEYEALYQTSIPDFLVRASQHPKKTYKLFKSPFGGSQTKDDTETSQFVTQPVLSTKLIEQPAQPATGFATYMGSESAQFGQQTVTTPSSAIPSPQLAPINSSGQASPGYDYQYKRYSTDSSQFSNAGQDTTSPRFSGAFPPTQPQVTQEFSPQSYNTSMSAQQGFIQQGTPASSPIQTLRPSQQGSSTLLPNAPTLPRCNGVQATQRRKYSMPCPEQTSSGSSFKIATPSYQQNADQRTLQKKYSTTRTFLPHSSSSSVSVNSNRAQSNCNLQTVQCGAMPTKPPEHPNQSAFLQIGSHQQQQSQPQPQETFNQQAFGPGSNCTPQTPKEQGLKNQLDSLIQQVKNYEEQKRVLEASIAQLQQQEKILKADIAELSRRKGQLLQE